MGTVKTLVTEAPSTPHKSNAKIHIFFCRPAVGQKGFFDVLGSPQFQTNKVLDHLSLPAEYQIIDLRDGADPVLFKKEILGDDEKTQDEDWREIDLNFFCLLKHRGQVGAMLDSVKEQFSRELVLHLGDEVMGWAAFSSDGYACGGVR